MNFFRIVKNRPAELLLELDLLPLNSREEFTSWLHFHDGGNEPTIHLADQLEIIAYPDEPLYCIEPWRSYGASTSGNSVDRGVTLDGSGSTAGSNVWYAMPEDYREAIGLILLYSDRMWDHSVSVTTTKKDSNPNVPLRIAT